MLDELRIGRHVVSEHIHSESFGDADHMAANASCANDADRLAREIEALQAFRRESAGTRAFHGLEEAMAESLISGSRHSFLSV